MDVAAANQLDEVLMAPLPAPQGRRPWWAVAIAGGFGAVLAVLFALGFLSAPARGSEPHVATTSTAGLSEEALWRARMEQKLDTAIRDIADTREHVARMEGRLDRGR